MTEKQKIMVPRFIDDPLVGRSISPLPVIGFRRDKIIIEDGMLKYIGAELSGISNKSFCGAPTGQINVYEIPSLAVSEAITLGFERLPDNWIKED